MGSTEQHLLDRVWSADVTEATLASLVTDTQYLSVLAGIATRTESKRTLQRLGAHQVWTIRRIVAANDSAPVATLTTLLCDDISQVRRAVLVNAALPDTTRRSEIAKMAWPAFSNADENWCVRLGDVFGGPGAGALLLVLRNERVGLPATEPLELCDVATAAINNPNRPHMSH